MAGFPEHSLKIINTLMELGFNDKNVIDITSKVLKQIKVPRGYKEVENLWVKVEGIKNGKRKISEINCIVKTLAGWEDSGSNVDTGRTISIISQMLKKGMIKQYGVYGPEAVVPYDNFIKELGKRKMYVYIDGKRIN
jgi:saccharopine dehydrogenase-like NADP-dependent oxidoreductase